MFFYIKNLTATDVETIEKPWENVPEIPEHVKNKTQFSTWCAQSTTNTRFISAVEGVSVTARVSDKLENEGLREHAFIVDIDITQEPDQAAKLIARAKKMEVPPPSYLVTTFQNRSRLVWLYEAPIQYATKWQYRRFHAMLIKKLQVVKWLGDALDSKTAEDAQYYHIGRSWTPLFPDKAIPYLMLRGWFWEANKDKPLAGKELPNSVNIPLPVLEAEIQKRWPDGWKGSLTIGAQGRRFWDPQADNMRAVVVRKDGFQCFTGSRPFMSWRDLLGEQFVSEYHGKRVSSLDGLLVYEETKGDYYVQDVRGDWLRLTEPRVKRHLGLRGFNTVPPKGEAFSEVDRILDETLHSSRVEHAATILYQESGIIEYQGLRILNTSTITPIEPVEEGLISSKEDFKNACPFIYDFIHKTFFCEGNVPFANAQIDYLLSWMARFYVGAYYQKPVQGHGMIIAGPQHTGKTMFANAILAQIMGGGAVDAAPHLVEGKSWTDLIARNPVALIDDSGAKSDFNKHAAFSAAFKKLVANGNLFVDGKYKSNVMVEFNGRSVILLNDDSESKRMLPSAEISNADKFSMLMVRRGFEFPGSKYEIQSILVRELPFFARYLMCHKTPEYLKNPDNPRFGSKAFQHPELYWSSMHQGRAQYVYELLASCMEVYEKTNPGVEGFSGSAVDILRLMQSQNSQMSLKIDTQSLGTCLNQLQSRGLRIIQTKAHGGINKWFLPIKMQLDTTNRGVNPMLDGVAYSGDYV